MPPLERRPFKNTFQKHLGEQRPKRTKTDPSPILKPNFEKAFKTPFQKHLSKPEPI
jgi:hypothetical protein